MQNSNTPSKMNAPAGASATPATHMVVNEKPSRIPLILSVAAFAVFAGFSGYLYSQLKMMRAEVAVLNASVMQEVNAVRENSVLSADKNRRELEETREELAAAIKTAQSSAGRAKIDAKKHAEKLAQDLAVQQEAQQQEIAEQLSSIQDETASRFEEVSGRVGEVRGEIASNRSEIDNMGTGLKSVNGDLGVMSGRIATNGEELAALKALGERNYFEFEALASAKEALRVGDGVRIDLRHTDPGKNRFTMDVFADDRRISKKNRTVNEPIQFYVGGRGGLPYEIVVNDVDRGVIKGYLSTPKTDMMARR